MRFCGCKCAESRGYWPLGCDIVQSGRNISTSRRNIPAVAFIGDGKVKFLLSVGFLVQSTRRHIQKDSRYWNVVCYLCCRKRFLKLLFERSMIREVLVTVQIDRLEMGLALTLRDSSFLFRKTSEILRTYRVLFINYIGVYLLSNTTIWWIYIYTHTHTHSDTSANEWPC